MACSLDIEKAFDSVWREGLLFKIRQMEFPSHLVSMIYSFLQNRHFFIQLQQTKSENCPSYRGIPQGSIFVPKLYNLFIHDFPHTVYSNNTIISEAILFADDTIVYAPAEYPTKALINLKRHLVLINNFYKTWGIQINKSKSEAIGFRNAS